MIEFAHDMRIQAGFPEDIRVCEVDTGIKATDHAFMVSQFVAIVIGDRMNRLQCGRAVAISAFRSFLGHLSQPNLFERTRPDSAPERRYASRNNDHH